MNRETQPMSIGERLVRAAQLAAAAHLGLSMSTPNASGRRIVIGGAGPTWFTDEPSSSAVDRPEAASDRSTLSAEGGAE